MHRSPSRPLIALAGLFVLSLLSCGREVTGPDDGSMFGRVADLAVAPSLPGPMSVVDGSGSVVPFTRVRVILQRTNGEELLSRIVDFPASASEVPLSLEFPLPPEAPRDGLPLLLFLRYMNATGDTVFAGGPVQVIARPRVEGQAPQQVPIALEWVGPGSSAVRVEITPVTGSALSGTTTTFTAVAFDAQNAVVDGAPIVFSTPDPTRVSFGAPGSGSVTWSFVRGAARVIASLPSGPSDTASFDVQLPPSQLQVVSGGAQSALVGSALSAPVVLRVTAVDALPVAGVTVDFSVRTGGGSLSAASAVSDANGDVSVNWTLGALPGVQAIDATFAGLGAQVLITAIATALPPAGLVFTTQPAAVIAGATLAPVVVEVRDAFNALSATYFGPVSLLLDAGQSNATLGGTTTVNAVAGIATFAALNVQTAGIWTLTAEIPDLATGGSNEFTVSPAAAAALTLVSGNAQTMNVGLPLTEPLVVRLADAFGNAIPGEEVSFSVTLGGGSMNVSTAVTDEAGLAVAEWTLGPAVGLHGARATLTGQPTPFVDFTATAVSGGAVRLAATTVPASMTAGAMGAFVIQAYDAFDNLDAAFAGDVTVSITAGPGGAALQGTATRTAVAGVASFDDLRLDAAGLYTLTFASTGLSSSVVGELYVGAGAATSFTIVSGNGQLGLISALLASPLIVRVADAFGNGVDASVSFAVTTGGGTVGSPTDPTDGGGFAQTSWTLGALVGAQSVTASTAGLPDLTFTATAAPLTGLRTWTGAFNTDWSLALNWENGLVPTSLDTVLVPVTTTPPALVDNVVISGLTIADGASMAIGGSLLTIAGSLVAPVAPSITAEVEGGLGLIGTTGAVRGTLPTLFILNGAYSLSGALLVEGDLSLTNGTLTVDAFPVTVQGDFLTGGTGALAMLPGSLMTVGGDAIFTGGSTAGLLTGGRLNIGGDFVQVGGSPSAFSASPAHETRFVADTEQNVTFAAPAFGAGFSHFGTLYVGQGASGSLRLLSEAFVDGALETGGAPTSIVVGAGQRVVSRGADIGSGGITFDNVVWELLDGAPVAAIPQLRFRNMDPLATQFRVSRAGGAFTIVNAIFETAPTTGYYLNLLDTAADADILTVTLTNVSPTFHGGRITLSGGAQLVGWQDVPNFTWTGAVSDDWTTAANWSGGVVPGAADSVTIPGAFPTAPSLPAGGVTVRAFVSEYIGGDLILNQTLTVTERLRTSPTAGLDCVGASVNFAGATTPGAITGRLSTCTLRVLSGTLIVDNVTSVSDVQVEGTALLSVPGTMTASNFSTLGSGRLQMNGPAGTLHVINGATFGGGTTTGLLTAGRLRVGGNFSQLGSATSFAASAAHITELYSACAPTCGALSIEFADGLQSHFANLEISSGSRTVAQYLRALGGATIRTGANVVRGDESGLAVGGAFTQEVGATVSLRDLQVGGLISIAEPFGYTVDRLTLTGADQSVPYTVSHDAIIVLGTAVASFPAGGGFSIGADSVVIDGGELRVGFPGDDAFMDVGVLRTQNGGRLRMQDANANINVNVAASFAGGSTAGLLTAGQINMYGTEFVQAGGAPVAFSASPGHATRFLGVNGHTAAFANPGTGPLTSHFGDLEIALGAGGTAVELLSDLFATGVLRNGDAFQRRFASAVPRRVFSSGANVSTFSFSNVSWTLGDGAAVTAMNAITFENMDPTAQQLRIERASGTIPFTAPVFASRPTSGRYVTVRDTDGSGDLVLAVSGASPSSHGGYAVAENNAQITGWTEAGLYQWNAGVSANWNDPLAWSPQRVPGPADIALIPSFTNGSPSIASGDTVRIGVLRVETTIPLPVLGRLMVRDSLGSFSPSPLTCDGGGGLILNNPSGGAIPFRLVSTSCTLDIINGTARPTELSRASIVRVAGDGLLDLNGRRLDASIFSTAGRGRLRMVNPGDSLVISGPAAFGGESTDGLLTNGNLVISGGLSQSSGSSPSSFAATGAHITSFQGAGSSAINLASGGATTSRFARLWSFKNPGTPLLIGTGTNLHVAGNLEIFGGNFTMFGPGSSVILGSLFAGTGSTVNVDINATLTTTACTGTGTFTGTGTYIGTGCPGN